MTHLAAVAMEAHTTIFVISLLLQGAHLAEYMDLPYTQFMSRFSGILERAEKNGGNILPNDVQTLENLKKAILNDCRDGKLQEYNGAAFGLELPVVAGIPQKTYKLHIASKVTQDQYYWVLPAVECDAEEQMTNIQPQLSKEKSKSGKGNARQDKEPDFDGFIKRVRSDLKEQADKSGITMKGVPKPPK